MMLDMGTMKTPIGIKIESATHKELVSTNWALNLEICDMVNSAQDGPQLAVKALRARLQQRDDKVVDHVLMLLDTLVKNCGRRFHLLVATRDFMCDLIRLVSPRDPTPQHTKDKALVLIERCSDAFANDKDLSAVGEAYQYLKSQNVVFPAQNLDDMVVIHTPRPTHPVTEPPATPTTTAPATPSTPTTGTPQYPGRTPTTEGYMPPPVVGGGAQTPGFHPSGISHNDLQRLNKELLVVRGNDGVLNDILADLQSNTNPKPDELQLLQDLYRTCKDMHVRMVELLEQVEEEGLVCQLLDLIDKLNNTFLRYDRHLVTASDTTPPTTTTAPQTTHNVPAVQQNTPNIYAEPYNAAPHNAAPYNAAPQNDASQNAVHPGGAPLSQSGAHSSDIQELLSLDVSDPMYSDPIAKHPHDTSNTNPFIEMVDAPVSRLPSITPGKEDEENIYTTSPNKIPVSNPEDIHVTLDSNVAGVQSLNLSSNADEFDMFAQTRSSSMSDRVNVSSSEVAYEAAHDVPQETSLASAVHSRPPVTDDHWLHDLNTAEPTTQVMSSEDFDRFLNERAPAPPSTTLQQNKRKDDDDLLAL